MAFSLSDIRYQPPFHINHNIVLGSIGRVIRAGFDKFDLDVCLETIGVHLQRDYVWLDEQKEQLIWDILKGKPIGSISVIEHMSDDTKVKYQVVDGKQRLSTIASFVNGNFSIEYGSKRYLFSDLSKEVRMSMERYDIKANIAYSYWDDPISDVDKFNWFVELNFLGTPQDKSHVDNIYQKIHQHGRV